MGGGYLDERHPGVIAEGLSPHGRGILVSLTPGIDPVGPIPAWAGDTPTCAYSRHAYRAYPRMGGGYRRLQIEEICRAGLSPHGRGIP